MNKEPPSLGDIIGWIIATPFFGWVSWMMLIKVFPTQKGIEAALDILFGLLFGCVALMMLVVLIVEIPYRHKYMKQKPMNAAIEAFNNGHNRPRWFALTSGFKTIRNRNGRVIRITKFGSRRVCCVDKNGKFLIATRDWFLKDDFIPGKYIVSKTTGKLTFMYLNKNYR